MTAVHTSLSITPDRERPLSGKAVASVPFALPSVAAAVLNIRDTSTEALYVAMGLGAASLFLTAWTVADVWRGRVYTGSLLFAVPGGGAGLLALIISDGVLGMHAGDARVIEAVNHLKVVVMALDGYAKVHGRLPPPAVYGQDGTPLLSWRVLVLPYMGEEALFRQFRLDEPWDSPHNLPLQARMPPAFAPPCGTDAAPYHTFWQGFLGPGTAFEGTAGVRLTDFPDGLGNTILVVDGAEAVPWTKPLDLAYAPQRVVPSLGGIFRKSFCAGFADGHIKRLPKDMPEVTLRALIIRNGGEPAAGD